MAVEQAPNQPYIPAWKRLGLKLKNGVPANGQTEASPSVDATSESKQSKRKVSDVLDDVAPPSSRPDVALSAEPEASRMRGARVSDERPPKRKKSVSFVDGTKKEDGDFNEKLLEDYVASQKGGQDQFSEAEIAHFTVSAKDHSANRSSQVHKKTESQPKARDTKQKPKKKRVDPESQPQQDLAYISYLKQYHSSRPSWKFNKNHQTKLLQNLYNMYRLPTEFDEALSLYLSGLQGDATKKRLAEAAEKIISETDKLEGADANMPRHSNLDEAKERALRAKPKQTNSLERNEQAVEETSSEEHKEKLQRRKRAELILKSLNMYPSISFEDSQQGVSRIASENDAENGLPTKRKKVRRSRKMRTGAPDDDDTDETSSMSSIPSSATSTDEGDESSEDVSSGSDSSSEVSTSSASESSSEESSDESASDTDSDEK
ncbi:uncharacterized protein PV09_00683 [Verruconis gallopava]|uniref:WKF domain-containing protein n=1 Tax=Verruconis gallopava TaxID=253628 RepID=A0A0D2AQE6_9PEZI|nr:uncharacterized protein PV09_00683 [Verruconis gallopava]KIW08745.1 hypothetical protein PV09_00683 [Verruconis gallopava]